MADFFSRQCRGEWIDFSYQSRKSYMRPELHLTRPSSQLATRQQQVSVHLAAQKKKDTVQSFIVAAVLVLLLGALLALIAILPSFREVDIIVTYQAPVVKEEVIDRPKDMARGLKPKPASSSSSMARVIAATTPSDIAVPVPEIVDPTRPFGMDDDYNAGFGSGDGDGDGGGGSSFFGTKRTGRRVAYVVDFSLSMESDCEGGTRIQLLKKELSDSIKGLSENMRFKVIYFSHNAWTDETPGPNQVDKGWNGLGEVPMVEWMPADKAGKEKAVAKVNATAAQGNTGWHSPLKMALSMSPPPDVIYLLSDGEARDTNMVMDDMKSLNPTGIPIDTIAFELPGTPAYNLSEIAKMTGGSFVLYHEGKRYAGMSASKFLGTDFDP
jgi:hypothetical protein